MECNFKDYYSTCNIIFEDGIRIDYAISFSNSQYYNGKVTMPNTLNRCDNMFNNCMGYNAPVLIKENVTSVTNMFKNCRMYNQPILLSYATNLNSCSNMMDNCTNFNPTGVHINIPDSVTSCYGMFKNCTNFNVPITLGNNVNSIDNMFNGCEHFNQPLNLIDFEVEEYVGYPALNMLKNCKLFNSDIHIGSRTVSLNARTLGSNIFDANVEIGVNQKNCSLLLSNQTNFNSSVSFLGNNVNSFDYMFENCVKFNKPINLPNNSHSFSGMFSGCTNFNQSVTIPDNSNRCGGMFSGCINLNKPISIGNNVKMCNSMFSGCTNFNQSVTIPDSVENCEFMFRSCLNFNSPVTIGNNVKSCESMFLGCISFEQSITIPDSVETCYRMFRNTNFSQITDSMIHIGSNVKNCDSMFYNATINQARSTIDLSIPEGVVNCSYLFGMVSNCVVNITIPSSAEYAYDIFSTDGRYLNCVDGDIYYISPNTKCSPIYCGEDMNFSNSYYPVVNVHYASTEQMLTAESGLNACVNGSQNWANADNHEYGWYPNYCHIFWVNRYNYSSQQMEYKIARKYQCFVG